MPLPQTYGTISEGAIASYDYFDIAEGTGMKMFYALSTDGSDGKVYLLNANPLFTKYIETDSSVVGNTLTFSLGEFNTPKILNGTALVTGSLLNGATGTGTLKFELQRNTTEIGSTNMTLVNNTSYTFAIEIDLDKEKFEKGDSLKFVLTFTPDGTNKLHLGIDPQNRDGVQITPSTDKSETTQLKVYIPFNIDI